jgi:SAM-dependent methyltransferase
VSSTWISYNDLAWTEDLLADPAEYEDEVRGYVQLIKGVTKESLHTMLHLGSGAGGHDKFFNLYFTVTGVDLSLGMLNEARISNPEIEYHEGDMRTIRLDRQFDIVAIPDSIDYMVSQNDLRQAIQTCVKHLKPGGILLIVAKTEETFQNNNFAYEGAKGDIHVTLLENNYINPLRPNTYEATFVYLIRQHGELSIRTESQILGLFPLATWEKLFGEFALKMQKSTLNDVYDKYLLCDGEYPMTVFIGQQVK